MWVNGAQAGDRKYLGANVAGQRAEVAVRDRNRRKIGRSGNRHHRVIRWVLNHVEGDVAEVALVSQAITSPHAHLSVASRIVGETKTWCKVVLVGLPQLTD